MNGVGLLVIAAAGVVAIYLAGMIQFHGAVVATNQLLWIIGGALLGVSAGVFLSQ